MVKIRRGFGKVVGYFTYVSIAACFLMMVITTLDVAVRKSGVFNIKGSNELVEIGMVILVFLGVASLQVKDGHVKVDMLVARCPRRLRHFVQSAVLFVEVLIYGSMSYACISKLLEYLKTPVYTGVLEMPYAPFYVIMIVGLVSFTVLLLMDSVVQLTLGFGREVLDVTLESEQDRESNQAQAI